MTTTLERTTVFDRVLVGLDGSAESREAARQAAILRDPEGSLALLAVWDTAPVLGGTGTRVPHYLDEDVQRGRAEESLAAARRDVPGLADAPGEALRGCAWEELVRELERGGHTLVAVGSRGDGRLRGIVVGSTTTQLVHKAPSSVLVAREAPAAFPRRIVVGVDGSPGAAAAHAAAQRLAERFDAELRVVSDAADPVRELVAAAAHADLLVVGSRGLTGLKALGSVAERVAHDAASSVLIVRD